ncbi:MAG: 30S ribosomal protein S24e [Thermoplasmata archaeon]|nr:30S ribosomal protein S24e [Thermoplasmata archaeon]
MELEILEKRENPLLNRTEVKFRIKHEGEKTPERELVKNDLAEELKVSKDLIIIDYIRPHFGIAVSSGYAKIYKSVEDGKKVEPDYVLKRNNFGIKTKEEKKEKEEEVKEAEAEKAAEGEEVKEEAKSEEVKEGEEGGGS